MGNLLIQYFSEISPLSPEEIEAMEAGMEIVNFGKGDYLLRTGQIQMDTYFVLEGCVRQYYLLEGEEKTTQFFTEGQWIVSLNGEEEVEASSFFLQCTEPTALVVGNESQAQEMFEVNPRFETLARRVMEKAFNEQQKWLTSYQTSTPEQRYLSVLRNRPQLVQRIPQYQLASYIGVKPESLSRIRKRLQDSGADC